MTTDVRPVAIITGASSGIGEALVRQLVRDGFRVAGLSRNLQKMKAIQTDLAGPGEFSPVVCDVGTEVSVGHAVGSVISKWGRVDWLVANAGFGVVGRVADLSAADYQRQLDVNFFGVLHCIQAALPELRKSRGRIGIVGSVNSYVSLPGNSAYAASKFMLLALSESLLEEERGDGVSVTFIAPGFVKTHIRHVNNLNQAAEQSDGSVPEWMQMRAEVAARKIARGIRLRKSLVIVTFHARLLIWMKRLSPSLWRCILRGFGISARNQPT